MSAFVLPGIFSENLCFFAICLFPSDVCVHAVFHCDRSRPTERRNAASPAGNCVNCEDVFRGCRVFDGTMDDDKEHTDADSPPHVRLSNSIIAGLTALAKTRRIEWGITGNKPGRRAVTSGLASPKQAAFWRQRTNECQLLRALQDPAEPCVWGLEFGAVRGHGYLPREVRLVYRTDLPRYDTFIPPLALQILDKWKESRTDPIQRSKLHDLEQCPKEDWGRQVRLECVETEDAVHTKRVQLEIHLAPHKFLYCVGIQQQLSKDDPALFGVLRQQVYEHCFWNAMRGLTRQETLLLPSQFALHMIIISADNHALLRQRRAHIPIYPNAWEASVGEFMHGPLVTNPFPHFDGPRPDLRLFCMNAVKEEVGIGPTSSNQFRIYGFAIEQNTLAPKLMIVHRSAFSIQMLLDRSLSKKAKDGPQDAKGIGLTPEDISARSQC